MFDVEAILTGGGILAVALIVFSETGLLVGFFLPGDSLLFSAGILAAQGLFPIEVLIPVIFLAAVAGDNTGYFIGQKAGPKLFKKKDGLLFKQEYIKRAEDYYSKHGGKTITFAKFMPIVRTFAPVVAGIGKMPRQKFILFSALGALFWGVGVTMTGYIAGNKIPNIEKYIAPTILAVIILSFGPAIYHLLKDTKIRSALVSKIRGFKK